MNAQDLVKFAVARQGDLRWDLPSLIRVGGELAVKVNGIQNLSGTEKQKLVCQVLKIVLEDEENKMKIGKSEDEIKRIDAQFEKLKSGVDDVLPASLELAIAAARGKFDLKKVKVSQLVKMFSCCAASAVTVLESAHVISAADAKKAGDILSSVESKASDVAQKVDDAKESFEKVNPMRAVVEAPVETAVAAAPAVAEVVAVALVSEVKTASSEADAKTESKSEETVVAAAEEKTQ